MGVAHTTSGKLLLLVDGSSYVYRAFHALPPLSTSRGEPTGAVHGVAAMLKRVVKDHAPDYLAVVFDAKGKTFRDDLYAQYKAYRPAMPDDLRAQIEPLHALVRAMGVPILAVEGVEADDVIATLATEASAAGIATLIASSDKDLAQLVDERVWIANDNMILDAAAVKDKFGVPPGLIVDYLALIGDKTDNVPGVPKVGPKTAAGWLERYGSLDGVIAHAGEIPGRIGENLRAALPDLPLSKHLVTVLRDVPLEVGPEDLAPSAPDIGALKVLYTRLEFKTWLDELLAAAPQTAMSEGAVPCYETVLTRAELDAWLERLCTAELIAIDTKTTSLAYMQARIIGVSFAVETGHVAYVPFGHDYEGAPAQLSGAAVLEALRPILEDPARGKLGHNLKYDMSVFATHGIALSGIRHDSMIESYVLDSTATRHDLDSLALKYLGVRTTHYEDVAGKGTQQVTFNRVPLERAGPYAAEDVDMAWKLHEAFRLRLCAEPGLTQLYEDIEVPLIPVLSRIERNGVCIDTAMLREQSRELGRRLRDIEEEAHEAAGMIFNLDSPKQIQEILFERLRLPATERTPKGQPSTAESVLQELALDYPLPRLILEYRSLAKLRSTYTEKLPQQVDPDTGRVHTSYHQAVAATGRLSSADPNLQNIPVRTEEGRRIRRAFVAPPGYRLIAGDYSQIELRIMAHLSADPLLIAAFAEGQDIHRATASEVFGVAPELLSAEHRRAAKAINFGLLYGMSAFGLARQLGIERGAAQEYVDRYFARYFGVRAFMDRIRSQARRQGYVETVFHRRLHLPEINSQNAPRRQYAERTAINAPMQGTAADLIKLAMIRVDRWIADTGVDAKVILQVHDELVLEVAEDAVDVACRELKGMMESVAQLNVPLAVDVGVGTHWDEAH